MKAAVIHTIGDPFVIEDVELSAPIGREVVVEVKASGLCHSDLHLATNDFRSPLPMVLGHEISGIVTELGPDVRDLHLGDRVVGSLVQFCGHCAACRDARTYQCQHPEQTLRPGELGPRITRNGAPVQQVHGLGGFAERVLAHENQLVPIPDDIPFPQAAILGCGTITGAGSAINTARVRSGDTVAVIGLGGVGLNVISGARLAGAERIVAIDLQPSKLELALTFGATDLINSSDTDPVEVLHQLLPAGVNHAFEVVGLKSTTQQAIQLTGVGGSTYLIGMHKPGTKIEIDPLRELIRGQKRIYGVFMGSTNIKHDIPLYATLYKQGRLDLDHLISQEISLAGINDAYDLLKSGAVARSVITNL